MNGIGCVKMDEPTFKKKTLKELQKKKTYVTSIILFFGTRASNNGRDHDHGAQHVRLHSVRQVLGAKQRGGRGVLRAGVRADMDSGRVPELGERDNVGDRQHRVLRTSMQHGAPVWGLAVRDHRGREQQPRLL